MPEAKEKLEEISQEFPEVESSVSQALIKVKSH
jgi:hypothetical protein